MSGFVGWSCRAANTVDADHVRAAWRRGETSSASALASNQGLVWNHDLDPIDVRIANQSWVVVDGRPRWRDAGSAEVARRHGNAAAVFAAFDAAGSELTRHLSGSYAIALFDGKSAQLLLVTDRFGTRPLAYGLVPDGFVCGSNTDLIRRHGAVGGTFDLQSIYDYFFFHVVPSPRSIFTGIHKLEPGQIVTIGPSGVQARFHWRPSFCTNASRAELTRLAKDLPSVLAAAVKNCEPGPGFGSYLSGGLDSSAVSGFLSKTLTTPTPAYCVGFDQAGYDEMEFARIAARHFNLLLREIYATPEDVAEVFGFLAATYDEPFGNASVVPAYLCARAAAADGLHHLLAGDGGDELFGGNTRYVRQNV